jgi:hypothetical protein
VLAVGVRRTRFGVAESGDQDVHGRVSRRRAESNHRLPGSARVAAVNRSTSPGQRLVQSGLVSNFTTMKIITVWAEAEIATTRLSGAA